MTNTISKRIFCLATLILVATIGPAVPAIGGEDTLSVSEEAHQFLAANPWIREWVASNERHQQHVRELGEHVLKEWATSNERHQQQIQLLQQRLQAANEVIKGDPFANLPQIQNGHVSVFHLKHIGAEKIADVLNTLYGSHQMRLAPDSERNSLVVFAPQESLEAISKIVQQLDVTNKSSETSNEEEEAEAPQSLMVRIFWLADGLPEGEGSEANLPKGVLDAVGRLGLRSPRLVTQSTASLVGNQEGESKCNSNFPVILHGNRVQFSGRGMLRILDEHPQLDFHAEVGGQFNLSGKLSAPLGHYMVLGTANYVATGMTDRKIRGGGRRGTGGGGGRGTGDDRSAHAEGKPKPSTSRFALVVQVIEAESFAPEE